MMDRCVHHASGVRQRICLFGPTPVIPPHTGLFAEAMSPERRLGKSRGWWDGLTFFLDGGLSNRGRLDRILAILPQGWALAKRKVSPLGRDHERMNFGLVARLHLDWGLGLLDVAAFHGWGAHGSGNWGTSRCERLSGSSPGDGGRGELGSGMTGPRRGARSPPSLCHLGPRTIAVGCSGMARLVLPIHMDCAPAI
jgi:hypothetical protein